MKHQFYMVYNPKAPADPHYIFHAKPPRFFALVTPDGLELDDVIDAGYDRIKGKFKRMEEWYRDYLLNKTKYDEHRNH